MSRGLGRIERHILGNFEDDNGEPVLCAEDLADTIYGYPCTRAQRLTVLRAMHSFVGKYPQYVLTGGKGRDPLWLYDARVQPTWLDEDRPAAIRASLAAATKGMLMRAANLEMQANECRAAAGERLLKLRQHLPRGKTWVQYVRDRFGLSGKRADELIALNSATKPGRTRRRRAPNITATAAHRQRAQRYSGQKKNAAPR